MRPERGSSPVMGLLSASSIDRNEPALAPEWLKGVGHASPFSVNQGNQRYSSRYKAPSERISEREINNFRSYSNFGRRFSEREPGRDWDWSRDRRIGEKERFYSGPGYFEDKDRDRGFGLYRPPVPRPEFERRQSENVDKRFGSAASRVERTFPVSDGQFAPKPTPPPRIPRQKNEAERMSVSPSTQGVGSRDKLKTKASEVLASKPTNGYGYRNGSTISEGTSGRLLVLKASKEAAALARPSFPHPVVNGSSAGKQLVDRRAVPIPVDSNNNRPKNGIPLHEEKKPAICGQNRSDFFNAIRKKAAANGENRKTVEKDRAVEAGGEKSEDVKQSSPDAPKREDKLDEEARFFAIVGGSEEEETALLRSLGWEEGDEDALTADEINAFIQEHMRCLTSSPSILNRQSQRLRNAILDLERQGNASSGSDSEDEARS